MDRPHRLRALRLLPLLVPFLIVAAVWSFVDLSSFKSAEDVAAAVRDIGGSRMGFVYVPLGFALGTLLFLPVTALIAGTSLAFDPLRGLVFSMAGSLLGASAGYGLGRLLGSSVLDWLRGPRLAKLVNMLHDHSFRSAVILRLLPVGHFTAINLLAGSLRIPFGGFLLGNAVGLLPGILFFTFLSGQIPQLVRSPTVVNLLILAGGSTLILVLAWLVRRWAHHRRHHWDAPA